MTYVPYGDLEALDNSVPKACRGTSYPALPRTEVFLGVQDFQC